ncbi:MAG TPA: Dyp-type peroxidase, partial [Minicystis sp.]|nr:Dyp-type peroxidase [Minicystis sp.]
DVRHGRHDDWHRPRVNVAFGWGALRALGVSEADAATFPREFRSGMADRARILSDDPASWRFGAPGQPTLDVLVLAFAKTERALDAFAADVLARLAGALDLAHQDRAIRPRGGREHFGFRDGIANPIVRGLAHAKRSPEPECATGEFVLGHKNGYDKWPASPSVDRALDAFDELPGAPGGRKDLGFDGTYLVYRKLEEDVGRFRAFLKQATLEQLGKDDVGAEEWLAARIVGRWKSGAPVALAPERDDPKLALANAFLFGGEAGTTCPVGAHVRRANPRDALPPDPATSLENVSRHRILRRGRRYGREAPSPLPPSDAGDRGIVFICLNANLERQFEFVQQTWIHSTKFAALYDESDPLVGRRDGGAHRFSLQGAPARVRLRGLPEFVTMRGGGYFFLPGLRALRALLGVAPKRRADGARATT